jgi:DnaJ-class molecular chaperone
VLSQPRIDDGAPPARVLGYVQLDGIEAARGTRREVEVIDEDLCGDCDGSGAVPGAEALACATCGGKGTVRASAGLRLGRWLKVEPCPACEGEGRLRTPCPTCAGRGELRRERTIEAHIPSGVEDGMQLRLAGEDENAYLVVRVKPLPSDSFRLRLLALALLACAVALLVYFVVWV